MFPQSGCFTRAVTRAAAALRYMLEGKKIPLGKCKHGYLHSGGREKKNPPLYVLFYAFFLPISEGMLSECRFTPARDGTLDIYMYM